MPFMLSWNRCTSGQHCKARRAKHNIDLGHKWECLECPPGMYTTQTDNDHWQEEYDPSSDPYSKYFNNNQIIPAQPKCVEQDEACLPQKRCSVGEHCKRSAAPSKVNNKWAPWSCEACPTGYYSDDQDHWQDATGGAPAHALCTEACKEQPPCGKAERYWAERCAPNSEAGLI